MLRNPTRAISHYHMEVNNKNESRLSKALDEEDKTINKEYKNLIKTQIITAPFFKHFRIKKGII